MLNGIFSNKLSIQNYSKWQGLKSNLTDVHSKTISKDSIIPYNQLSAQICFGFMPRTGILQKKGPSISQVMAEIRENNRSRLSEKEKEDLGIKFNKFTDFLYDVVKNGYPEGQDVPENIINSLSRNAQIIKTFFISSIEEISKKDREIEQTLEKKTPLNKRRQLQSLYYRYKIALNQTSFSDNEAKMIDSLKQLWEKEQETIQDKYKEIKELQVEIKEGKVKGEAFNDEEAINRLQAFVCYDLPELMVKKIEEMFPKKEETIIL